MPARFGTRAQWTFSKEQGVLDVLMGGYGVGGKQHQMAQVYKRDFPT